MNYGASIIIPLLQQPDHWLEQCVVSAVTQSISTEVIVVRSQLTPRSNLAVLERLGKQYVNLVSLIEQKPGNFPAAINQGIRAARTDRVGLLLSDDWLEPTAVAESLREPADIVSSGTLVHFASGEVNDLATRRASMNAFLSCGTVEEKARYLEHFFLFRKDLVLRVGGLDETIGNYPGIDDYDLIWTLLENGATVAIVERCLYHYRDHEGERLTLQDPGLMLLNLRKILRKHGIGNGAEHEIIKEHAPWYGRPAYQVLQEICASKQYTGVPLRDTGTAKVAEELVRRNDTDLKLSNIFSLARTLRLDRFVVDGVVPGEYQSGSGGSYVSTGRAVACRVDAIGRWRIDLPFCLRGHVVCTEPERMHSIFWCIDLLKSGYVFAYLPASSGHTRVSLFGHLGRKCLDRGRQWIARLGHRRAVAPAYWQMAHHRQPSYQPEPRCVLMVTSTYNRGGSERQMVATAAGLRKRGWDVQIMAQGSLQPGHPSFEDEIRSLGITPRFWSDFESANARASPSTHESALPRLFVNRLNPVRAAIRHYRPSVVHGWLPVPGVVSALAACELGVPRVIVGQRNSQESMSIQRYPAEIVEALWQGYRSLSANPAVTILNNTTAGAAGHERWLGLQRGTIRVLYNGYMPECVRKPTADEVAHFRSRLGWPLHLPVVGSVIRFERYKDPNLWLDTAAEIAKLNPDVRFLLAGYGTMHDEIASRIKALKLDDRIILPGPVTDVGLIYAAVDVVLLTSLCEGVPNVLLEAQAAGRPVVVTDFSTASEAMLHGRTGYLVAGRSARRLAQATAAILDDSAWAARGRIEGPAFVASHFDLERMLTETVDLYEMSTIVD
jgi:glycosyltransferase involved in cell wall biosynthesis/GT2 family glycosyltransferase